MGMLSFIFSPENETRAANLAQTPSSQYHQAGGQNLPQEPRDVFDGFPLDGRRGSYEISVGKEERRFAESAFGYCEQYEFVPVGDTQASGDFPVST